MPERLIKFTVIGIFDRQDIAFDFSMTPFFIVGPNGTGKSTALKVLHAVLSGQWQLADNLPFLSVEIDFENETGVVIDKPDFKIIERIERLFNRLPRRLRRPLPYPLDWSTARELLTGSSVALRVRRAATPSIDNLAEIYPVVAPLLNSLESWTVKQVLYFPTYRRVERDLSELLTTVEDIEDESALQPQIVDRFESFGEVVGFGGQDIAKLLADKAAAIDVAARQALNEHSVRFLETLSRPTTRDTRSAKKFIKSQQDTSALLNRIATFSNLIVDVEAISQSINTVRELLSQSRPGRLSQPQEMMLVYIGELIRLFETIERLSGPLAQFTNLINKYLAPLKSAELDRFSNRITIKDISGTSISPDQLSSGEKQILAFFAFLLLRAGREPRYIIIDEPELSLSVSWQKTLISDIISIRPSTYIVSATHSPFIFERFGIESVESLGTL